MATRSQQNRVDSSNAGGPDSVEIGSNGQASYDVRHSSDVVGLG